MEAETKSCCFIFELVSVVDREKNGRPKGDTHAAYVEFPSSFSRCLYSTYLDFRTFLIRLIYFSIFSFDLQELIIESYRNPKISILRAGGWHFLEFIFASVRSPTDINYSNINFVFASSTFIPAFDLFGPPKKSST